MKPDSHRMASNLYIRQSLEWIHCAIQEAMNGNDGYLERALYMLEDIRENFIDKEEGEVK